MKKFEKILAGILVAALVVLALAVGVKSYQRNHTKVEAKTPSAKDVEAEKAELTFDFDKRTQSLAGNSATIRCRIRQPKESQPLALATLFLLLFP